MLNTLIVGAGRIAAGFDETRPATALPLTHAGAYRAHGGFALAACIEPDPARRAAFMAHWGVSHGFRHISEALQSGMSFEVISICSPTSEHLSDLLTCASFRPRLIFCEKPLCSRVEDAQHAVDSLRGQGIALAVNHNRRWDRDVQKLRSQMARGHWGELRSASGVYNKGILNNGGHLLDLLQFLLGELAVVHVGRPVPDFWPDDPSVPALLSTARGIPVTLNCAHAADYALFEMQLIFEGGVVCMEEGGLRWRVRRPTGSSEFSGYRTLDAGESRAGDYMHALSNAVQNINDAVLRGAALASTGETALSAQRLCQQIRERALASMEFPT